MLKAEGVNGFVAQATLISYGFAPLKFELSMRDRSVAGVKIMAKSEWNVETLKEDIKKYTERKCVLLTLCMVF